VIFIKSKAVLTMENNNEWASMMEKVNNNEWVSSADAAKVLQISRATMHRWCKVYDNNFAMQIGRNWRVNSSECLRILKDGTMPQLRENATGQEGEK
jgi:hypothetical protein